MLTNMGNVPKKYHIDIYDDATPHTFWVLRLLFGFFGYLDLVQRLEFGVDHLQKNAVYQIE